MDERETADRLRKQIAERISEPCHQQPSLSYALREDNDKMTNPKDHSSPWLTLPPYRFGDQFAFHANVNITKAV